MRHVFGLNVWLIRQNGKLRELVDGLKAMISNLHQTVDAKQLLINDLRPKRDAHGRFTR